MPAIPFVESDPLCDVYVKAAILGTYLNKVLDTGIAAVGLRSRCVELNIRHLLRYGRVCVGRVHPSESVHI